MSSAFAQEFVLRAPETEFRELYNQWITLHWDTGEHADPRKLNVRAMQLWPDLKKAWDRMKRHVDEVYADY